MRASLPSWELPITTSPASFDRYLARPLERADGGVPAPKASDHMHVLEKYPGECEIERCCLPATEQRAPRSRPPGAEAAVKVCSKHVSEGWQLHVNAGGLLIAIRAQRHSRHRDRRS